MIQIKRTDVLINYIGYFFKLFSNIIVLPLVLTKVSSETYAMWIIFLSIGTIINLIDFGFGPVITRYSTYAFCGASNIPKTGLPLIKKDGNPNYELLFTILLSAKKIYKYISIITIVILLLPGSLYIYYLTLKNGLNLVTITSSWIIYVGGICIYMYFNFISNVIKGLGKIKEVQIANIISNLVYIVFIVIFLNLKFDLFSLTISSTINSIILVILLYIPIRRLKNSNNIEYECAKNNFKDNFNNTYASMKFNSKKIGLITITNYIQNQLTTILFSFFLDLRFIAAYGLSIQLIGIIYSFSSIPFTTYLPKINEYRLEEKYEKVKNYLSHTLLFFYVFYICGSLYILLLGNWTLSLIKSNTMLLSSLPLLLLIVYLFILNNHQKATEIISQGNVQPHVKAYLISSIIAVAFGTIILFFTRSFLYFIMFNIAVQIAYNGWKWPYMLFKDNDLKFNQMIRNGLKLVYSKINPRSQKQGEI